MKYEFVTYELALALKELKFNEYCLAKYDSLGALVVTGCDSDSDITHLMINQGDICKAHILAPLYQQAFAFFRENCQLDSVIQPNFSTKYLYRIYSIEKKNKAMIYAEYMRKEYNSYKEAEIACLKKLINTFKLKL